jgi:uncharacterized membrane protein YdfJ with MMPL/SSD domain
MKTLGRAGIWVAFLLMVLAGTSWAGFVLVRPLFFLIPALAILVAVMISIMLPRPRNHAGQLH